VTRRIVDLFRRPIKPLPDAVLDARYQTAVGQVLMAGDKVREFNVWRADFEARKGRAA